MIEWKEKLKKLDGGADMTWNGHSFKDSVIQFIETEVISKIIEEFDLITPSGHFVGHSKTDDCLYCKKQQLRSKWLK